jgi:hypothetical protein
MVDLCAVFRRLRDHFLAIGRGQARLLKLDHYPREHLVDIIEDGMRRGLAVNGAVSFDGTTSPA